MSKINETKKLKITAPTCPVCNSSQVYISVKTRVITCRRCGSKTPQAS